MALAARAGAALADLEFYQFHPTALALAGAPPFLISEAVRGEGAILRNAAGRAFMADYHPLAELAPRDVVARAIVAEMRGRPAASASTSTCATSRPTGSSRASRRSPPRSEATASTWRAT